MVRRASNPETPLQSVPNFPKGHDEQLRGDAVEEGQGRRALGRGTIEVGQCSADCRQNDTTAEWVSASSVPT